MKKHNQRKLNTSSFTRMDYLAVLPGILMCGITLIIFVMDLLMPEMAQGQYKAYPSIFRFTNILIWISGALFYILSLRTRTDLRSIFDLSFAPLLIFIILVLISTFVNGLNDKVLHGVSFRNIGVFHLIGFILIYYVLSSNIRNINFRRCLVLFYAALADLIAVSAIVDKYTYHIAAFGEKKDLSTIFFNGNHYGYFLVMAILISFGLMMYSSSSVMRIFGAASMLLNAAVLALNGSLGCMLAVILGVLFSLIITIAGHRDMLKQHAMILGAIIIFAVMYLYFSGLLLRLISDIKGFMSSDMSAGHNRMLLWTTTWDYVMKRPLFGYGCEGLSDILNDAVGRANPHNEVLNYACQYGIPAAIAYVIGILAVLLKGIRRSDDEVSSACLLACFGYFISSLFGVPMFYTLPFFFVFLGIAASGSK